MKDLPKVIQSLRKEVAEKLKKVDHQLEVFAHSSAVSQSGYNGLRDRRRAFVEVLELIDAIVESHQEEKE